MPVPLVLVPLVLVPLAPVPAAPVPFEPGSSRPLAAISRAPWSCSSCEARPQQIVNMQDPHDLAIRPDHEQRGHRPVAARSSHAAPRPPMPPAPMVLGARVITSFTVAGQQIGAHRAPQVAVGDDAQKRAAGIRHAQTAEAFLGHQHQRRGPWACPASASGIASPPCISSRTRRSLRAQPSARMKVAEIRLGKAASLQHAPPPARRPEPFAWSSTWWEPSPSGRPPPPAGSSNVDIRRPRQRRAGARGDRHQRQRRSAAHARRDRPVPPSRRNSTAPAPRRPARSSRDRRARLRPDARTAPACRSRRRSPRSCAPTWPGLAHAGDHDPPGSTSARQSTRGRKLSLRDPAARARSPAASVVSTSRRDLEVRVIW